jgi:hypothetical protein
MRSAWAPRLFLLAVVEPLGGNGAGALDLEPVTGSDAWPVWRCEALGDYPFEAQLECDPVHGFAMVSYLIDDLHMRHVDEELFERRPSLAPGWSITLLPNKTSSSKTTKVMASSPGL